MTDEVERLKRRAERERQARKQAEALLETRSRELFAANESLARLAQMLEQQVQDRTRDLTAALARAESATQAKGAFLATMSHELRTPMNGVLGMAQLLRASHLNGSQQAYVDAIASSGELLLSLINDVLDFSKIDAGRLELEVLPFDLRGAIDSVADLLRFRATEKGLDLLVEVAPQVPTRVLGDGMRLRQVLLNLVSNAIKFTAAGCVRIGLHTTAYPEAGRSGLCLAVTDTGLGIAADRLDAIFEPFEQNSPSVAREYGGTGLGLAISRRIAKLMGGSLTVDSELGQGASFKLQWTALLSEEVPDGPPASAMTDPTLVSNLPAGLRVLVVEDNPVNQMLLCAMLERLGCQPDLVHNGLQALEHLRHHPYDVVMMDLRMPELDGLSATRQLRQLPLTSQPKVIAVTANVFAEDRLACFNAGMDGFLAKPFTIETLRDTIQGLISTPTGSVGG